MPGEPLLTVSDLEVRYDQALAITGISLDVAEGSVVAVLGANGAGKSTLAKAIVGLVRPSRGRIVFQGRDITRVPPHRIARLGIAHLPEQRGIFPGLTVLDNLRMGLRHAVTHDQQAAAVDRAISHFPLLGQRRRQLARTLSGGEQQMLALARILAAPPHLLIADELSLGLAPILVDSIFETLAQARDEGITIVVVEQYVERALALADDAVILQRGSLVWRGPPAHAHDEVVARYLGEAAIRSE